MIGNATHNQQSIEMLAGTGTYTFGKLSAGSPARSPHVPEVHPRASAGFNPVSKSNRFAIYSKRSQYSSFRKYFQNLELGVYLECGGSRKAG